MPVGKGSLNRQQKLRCPSLELVPCVIEAEAHLLTAHLLRHLHPLAAISSRFVRPFVLKCFWAQAKHQGPSTLELLKQGAWCRRAH